MLVYLPVVSLRDNIAGINVGINARVSWHLLTWILVWQLKIGALCLYNVRCGIVEPESCLPLGSGKFPLCTPCSAIDHHEDVGMNSCVGMVLEGLECWSLLSSTPLPLFHHNKKLTLHLGFSNSVRCLVISKL